MSRLAQLTERLARALAVLAGVVIVALMLASVVDVIGRTLFNNGLQGVVSFTEIALVVAVYLGLAYAEETGAHVRTPLLTSRLPPRVGQVVRLAGLILVVAVIAATAYYTGIRGIETTQAREYRQGIVQVPAWPARLAVPIGLAGLLVSYFWRIARLIRGPGAAPTAGEDPEVDAAGGVI